MHLHTEGTTRSRMVAIVSGLTLLLPASMLAAADGHIGADVASRFVYTDGTYGSEHVRLKGGYRLYRAIVIEAQVMSGGSDEDLGIEGFRKWSAGPMYGFFIKPTFGFHRDRVNVYALVGATRMETSYRFQSTGIEDKDRIWSAAAGAGMQYNFASGLSASLDVTWSQGQAKYPHLFNAGTGSESVITATVAAGLNYRF